jgi:hypothetical protein
MKVWLSVDGFDPIEGLEELSGWLAHEPELRVLVSIIGGIPSPVELGVAASALEIAVGSGGTITVLAASLKAFLAQPRRSDVRIILRTSGGDDIEIDAKRVDDVEALVRETLRRAD